MIDFSNKSRKQIQDEMLDQVSDDLDKRQGSIIQTALGPVAWYLEGTYLDLDKIQKNSNPKTAKGESLDLCVITRNITRNPAKPAVREGQFNIQIPEGSLFKTINGADSLIFESGSFRSEDAGIFYYELTCKTPGSAGNDYIGPIMPITAISGLTSAYIGKILVAGTDEEKDDSLRDRYFKSFDVASFGGNIAAYRNVILAIAGVGAVQVYPSNSWKGGGTVLCSILGDDLKPALPAIIESVQNIICPPENGEERPSANGYGMAPIGAAVTITTAEELELDITCNIQFSNAVQNGVELYQKEIEEKIQEYLQEVKESWGAPLKTHVVQYALTVYVSRIIYSILQIPDIVNVSNVLINGSGEDIDLVETAELQQIPVLGTVVINGG
mgnify:CR=1 FL=1